MARFTQNQEHKSNYGVHQVKRSGLGLDVFGLSHKKLHFFHRDYVSQIELALIWYLSIAIFKMDLNLFWC